MSLAYETSQVSGPASAGARHLLVCGFVFDPLVNNAPHNGPDWVFFGSCLMNGDVLHLRSRPVPYEMSMGAIPQSLLIPFTSVYVQGRQ